MQRAICRVVGVVGVGMAIAASAGRARAETDWAKGLVTADGLGLADRHAPSPAAAREPARRVAEAAARKTLATELASLPLAAGGTLGDKLADKAIAARVAAAVERALVIRATPHTDGSWNVTLGVPIEAIRQALVGPRTARAGDADPPVLVVEGVTGKPAVGVAINGVAGAALWIKEVPAWAKDAPRVAAATAKGGPATLFLIVTK